MDEMLKIKRGVNIYHYYFTLIVLVLFILINYYSRNFKVDALNIPMMLSVVTFLFGFLMNINFSMLTKKVHSLKEALSKETAKLISLYFLSKELGEGFHKKVVKFIDDYTVYTLRHYRNYELSRDFVYDLYSNISEMQLDSELKRSVGGKFLGVLEDLVEVREELEYLTSSKMEISLKIANYILGFALIILLFLNRGDWFTNSLFIVLSSVVVFIFLILEDYDDLKIEDYTANISNSEQIFDLIGKKRYYPQEILGKVKLEKGKYYRIGIYDSKSKKEKIFEIDYKSEKSVRRC